MINLTYKLMNNQSFNEALGALSNKGYSNVQVLKNITQLVKQYHFNLNKARETYVGLADTYLVKDDQGATVKADTQHGLLVKEGMEAEFEAKMKEFMETNVIIQIQPLKLDDLGEAKLSPLQVLTLEPLLDSTVSDEQPQQS